MQERVMPLAQPKRLAGGKLASFGNAFGDFIDIFQTQSGYNLMQRGFQYAGLCNRANEKCNDYGTYYVYQTQMLYEGKSSVGRKRRIGANLENAGSDKGIDSISVWAQEADKNGVYAGTVDASNWCHVIGHCIETIFVDQRNFEHDACRLI